MNIAKILARNGVNDSDIAKFFDHAGAFTAERIDDFLNTINDLDDTSLENLGSELFSLFTGGMVPQEFFEQIERVKNQVSDLTELQKKYIEEGLSAEE